MVSRCLSAAGISFCGHPSPARDSAPLAIGLPAQPRWTATGYHVPHTRDTTGKGALSTPGPAVLTRAGDNPRPAACRPSTARVLSPRHSHHPSGAASYEASVKGSRSSPARPSPHPWPPDDSGNPPAFPRAPHLRGQDPRTHAGAGTGSEHKPGTTPPALRHAGPPISEVHSQTCATSCRTHHLARPGYRQALRRARRRLLHPPPGPRTGNPPPDRKARSPRPHRQPPASRLNRPPRVPGSASAPRGAAACPAEVHSRIRGCLQAFRTLLPA